MIRSVVWFIAVSLVASTLTWWVIAQPKAGRFVVQPVPGTSLGYIRTDSVTGFAQVIIFNGGEKVTRDLFPSAVPPAQLLP